MTEFDALESRGLRPSTLTEGGRLCERKPPGALQAFKELKSKLSGEFCVDPNADPKDNNMPVGKQAAKVIAAHKTDLDDFVKLLSPKLLEKQGSIRQRLFDQFVAQTQSWSENARRAVLARYFGFPYWDRVAYPYTAFSGTGEAVHASVVRLSPRDAQSLSESGAARLSGRQLHHFGAFDSREGREHDYLWGRLDGAERLSKLLGETDPAKFFPAILDEEEKGDSPINAKTISRLRSCIQQPKTPICDQVP